MAAYAAHFVHRIRVAQTAPQVGHPQNDKLVNLLRRARFESVSEETRKMLDKIVLTCEVAKLTPPNRGDSNLIYATTKTLTTRFTLMCVPASEDALYLQSPAGL